MTAEDKPPTLADQAAAWVPPWARAPDADADPQPPAEEPAGRDGDAVTAQTDAQADAQTDPEVTGDGSPPVTEVAGTDLGGTVDGSVPALAAERPEPAAVDSVAVEPAAVESATVEAAEPGTVPEERPRNVPPAADAPPEEIGADAPPDDAVPPDDAALPDDAPLAEETPPEVLRGALEAILLVVDEPVPEVVLAQILEQPTGRVTDLLGEMAAEYADQGRGFELRRAAGGWRLYTRSDYAAYVERFVLDGQQVRLTQASLETLAVVAYKQPVTRSRISAIRGVNCDGVVRTLVARGLIEECGSEPETGAFLYRTTPLFLEKLGLDRLDQLPPLAPFLPDDVDEVAGAQG